MGVPNLELLKYLSENFSINTFIETGSGHGSTVKEALAIFSEVYTVELSEELYKEVVSTYGDKAHCEFGDSKSFLENILPDLLEEPILFWLDAHWSMGPTAWKENQCPLLDELEMINRREGNDDFIFIDDAHTFFSPAVLKPPYDVDNWPRITEIFDVLHVKDRYTVILASWQYRSGKHSGIVMPENAIISVPHYAEEKFIEWMKQFKLECPA